MRKPLQRLLGELLFYVGVGCILGAVILSAIRMDRRNNALPQSQETLGTRNDDDAGIDAASESETPCPFIGVDCQPTDKSYCPDEPRISGPLPSETDW